MRDYKKIKAWALADDFAVAVYRISTKFPADERYAMTSQVRRAAYSIAANIAEGAGRRTTRDFVHFLDMAKGSANEAEYFCHLAHRLGYVELNEYASLNEMISSTVKCLASYIHSVEQDFVSKG